MKWKKGQVYECPEANCGCEVTVTEAPAPGKGGAQAPTCCGGHVMKLKTKVG